jgi:hypothetical protein
MTAQPPDPIRTEGTGRRRFLGRLGAGGLAVAAVTFGRSGTAYAASCGCCDLAHCPPNIAYQTCAAHAAYSWRCYYSSGGINWQCQCCETSKDARSAYACWPR